MLEYNRHEDGVWNLPRPLIEDLSNRFPGVRFESPRTRAEAEALLPRADVVYGWVVRPHNFAAAKRLRWIHVSAAGVTPLLFPALVGSDVVLTNGRGLHAVSMAEHALGVMLAFARKLHLARDLQNARRWDQSGLWRDPPPFAELAGATLGLVGFGAVGAAVAERAVALGLHVIAVRRRPAAAPAPAHAQWPVERLPELLARSDWLVLAPALTPETEGLIGRRELARMKQGAVLVNLGRGALVDEEALLDALEEGRLAGAALDVFRDEPLPAANPLWRMPQVILTPHISGLGPRYWERAVEQFAQNLHAFMAGTQLENVVDKRAGY